VDNVVVKDLIADMSDGKSLGLLLKRLTNDHPPLELVPMISDRTRRLNIQAILFYCEQSLGLSPYTSITADRGASVIGEARWSLEGMLACDIRSILSLLIDLSHHFLSQFPLPSDLSIAIVTRQVCCIYRIT
jgi:hypothetical protein